MSAEITPASLAEIKIGKSTFTALDLENKVLEKIHETEQRLRLCRDFIERNRSKLAGLHWSLNYSYDEISITAGESYYCELSAKDIARRWPEAKWKRVKPDRYSCSDVDKLCTRDWKTKIEGMDVTMMGAEKFEPVPLPTECEVKL